MKKKIQLIIIFSFIIAAILSSYNFYQVTTQATDQNIFMPHPQGVKIVSIVEGGASDRAGLKVGDVITKINQRTFKTSFEADRLLNRELIGKKIEYEILRGSRRMTVEVELAPIGIQLNYLMIIITGLLLGLLGLYVGLNRPGLFEARLFSSATITVFLALSLSSFPRSLRSSPSQMLAMINIFLFILYAANAQILHLLNYFPTQRFKETINTKGRIKLIYGFAAVFFVPSIILLNSFFADQVFESVNYVNIAFLLFLFTGIIILNYKRKQIQPVYKQKVRLIKIVGFFFTGILVLSILANFLTQLAKILTYIPLSFILFPIVIFITIQKYRVFELTIIIKKNWLYYSTTTINMILITGLFIAIINLLPRYSQYLPVILIHGSFIEILDMGDLPDNLTSDSNYIMQTLILGYGILLSLIILKINQRLKLFIDRKFFRAKYDYRTALKEFSPLALIAPDITSLSRSVVENVNHTMHLKRIAFALPSNGVYEVKAVEGFPTELSISIEKEELDKIITGKSNFINLSEIEEAAAEKLKTQGVLYLQPVQSKNNVLGLLIIGEKKAESAFNKEDIELLNLISHQIATALENIRLHQEFSKRERLDHELLLARQIQLSSLPAPDPAIKGLDIYAHLLPANEVGGDYYDFFRLSSDELVVLIGDVSGKGMPAALFMSRIQGILHSMREVQHFPEKLLGELNHNLYNSMPRNSFFTISYLLLNTKKMTYRLARAGHNEMLIYNSKKQKIGILKPAGIGLGLENDEFFKRNLEIEEGRFNRGDIFLLFTDGVTETFNEKNEAYGQDKLLPLLKNHGDKTATQIITRIEYDLDVFRGKHPQQDDTTIIVLKAV